MDDEGDAELDDDLIFTRSLTVPRCSGQAIKARDAGAAGALQTCGSEHREAGRRVRERSAAVVQKECAWRCSICNPRIHRSPRAPTVHRPRQQVRGVNCLSSALREARRPEMNVALRYVRDFVASRFRALRSSVLPLSPQDHCSTAAGFWRALVAQLHTLALTRLQSKAKTLGITSSCVYRLREC